MTSTSGSITLDADGSVNTTDDLSLNNGGSVVAKGGSVVAEAYGNILVDSSSSLEAPNGNFTIAGAYQSTNAAGTTIVIDGTLQGGSASEILGGPQGDDFDIEPAASTALTLLPGNGTNDETIAPATISGPVTVSYGAGQGTNDSLTVKGTSGGDTFTLTATSAAVDGHVVDYSPTLSYVEAEGVGGSDIFNVYPSMTTVLAVYGTTNPPGNTLYVYQPAGQTTTLTDQTSQSGEFVTTGGYQEVIYGRIQTVYGPDKPPVVTAPGSLTVDENVPHVIKGLSVTDPDAGSAAIELVLADSYANLSLVASNPSGVTVTGANTTRMVLLGSQSAIDAAHNSGVDYQPFQGQSAIDTLVVLANDEGNTGTGGPQTAEKIVTVSILIPVPAGRQPDDAGPVLRHHRVPHLRPGERPDQQRPEGDHRGERNM